MGIIRSALDAVRRSRESLRGMVLVLRAMAEAERSGGELPKPPHRRELAAVPPPRPRPMPAPPRVRQKAEQRAGRKTAPAPAAKRAQVKVKRGQKHR